jgi:hypothetical protein
VLPVHKARTEPRPINICQTLTSQAININPAFRNTSSCVRILNRLADATIEANWLDVLFEVLCALPDVYIVFDLKSTVKNFPTLSWPSLFALFLEKLRPRTVVKILFVTYGKTEPFSLPSTFCHSAADVTIRVDERPLERSKLSQQSRLVVSPRKGPGVGVVGNRIRIK